MLLVRVSLVQGGGQRGLRSRVIQRKRHVVFRVELLIPRRTRLARINLPGLQSKYDAKRNNWP